MVFTLQAMGCCFLFWELLVESLLPTDFLKMYLQQQASLRCFSSTGLKTELQRMNDSWKELRPKPRGRPLRSRSRSSSNMASIMLHTLLSRYRWLLYGLQVLSLLHTSIIIIIIFLCFLLIPTNRTCPATFWWDPNCFMHWVYSWWDVPNLSVIVWLESNCWLLLVVTYEAQTRSWMGTWHTHHGCLAFGLIAIGYPKPFH